MKGHEIVHQARLEGVYGIFRQLQATHDEFETKCIGSGNCCKIGLVISLGECWNIAKGLRRDYWRIAEDKGREAAQDWYDDVIESLVGAMHNDAWDPETNEQPNHCVFYKGGCSIYEYRPLVCRAYGVTAPVQEGTCPRKRLPNGKIELIRDDSVRVAMQEFDSLIKQWGKDNEGMDFSIYMPAGVLKFLLSEEEIYDLVETTEHKFWMGHQGYRHQLDPKSWDSEVKVQIGAKP